MDPIIDLNQGILMMDDPLWGLIINISVMRNNIHHKCDWYIWYRSYPLECWRMFLMTHLQDPWDSINNTQCCPSLWWWWWSVGCTRYDTTTRIHTSILWWLLQYPSREGTNYFWVVNRPSLEEKFWISSWRWYPLVNFSIHTGLPYVIICVFSILNTDLPVTIISTIQNMDNNVHCHI